MDKKDIKSKRIGHLTAFLIIASIAVLTGLAFLPVTRADLRASATYSIDADAMRVLTACRVYAETHNFDTTIEGTIRARAFGIPYSQNVSGSREKTGDTCIEIAESRSALAKAALRKESGGDSYKITLGKFDGKTAVYGEPTEYTREKFIAAYGKPNTGLVKYELDGAVTEAVCISDGVYAYKLDVARATQYCRNEVRSSLGVKKYPDYMSVELTLYADGDRPTKLTVCEKFFIDKFGGTDCTAEYTEVFDFKD